MAIVASPVQATLRLVVETGVDDRGNPVYRSRSYNRVKPESSEQDVYAVAVALAGLQQNPLQGVQLVKTLELMES